MIHLPLILNHIDLIQTSIKCGRLKESYRDAQCCSGATHLLPNNTLCSFSSTSPTTCSSVRSTWQQYCCSEDSNAEWQCAAQDPPTTTGCTADRPIQCTDGSCVGNNQDCSSNARCPDTLPIVCADGSCVVRIQDCSSDARCPENQIKCSNGDCRSSPADC